MESTALEKDILFEADHPFLCGMEYLFQSDTRLYFVLPFVGGGVLDKIVDDRARLEEQIVKFYAAQLIIGLGKLHERGVIHRDVKLQNIMVDTTGYIKIIDFGLAKALSEEQEATTFCGTFEYIAPELIRGESYGQNVDWWATGCIIFKMLFGVSPFFDRNQQVLMKKIQNKAVVFPDKRRFEIDYSDAVVDIIN